MAAGYWLTTVSQSSEPGDCLVFEGLETSCWRSWGVWRSGVREDNPIQS